MEEGYANICGQCKTWLSSIIQSHLVTTAQGGFKIMLGEEEIQQIFILYPVVLHKAYEEKVPLELSDEQAIMAKKESVIAGEQ